MPIWCIDLSKTNFPARYWKHLHVFDYIRQTFPQKAIRLLTEGTQIAFKRPINDINDLYRKSNLKFQKIPVFRGF